MEEHVEVTDFKASISFESRLSQSTNILTNYPGTVPVVIVKSDRCRYDLKTIKLGFPSNSTVSHVLFNLRKKCFLRKEDSLFLYHGQKLLGPGLRLGPLYQELSDDDGVLYLVVTSQEDKGSC
mmetsp:Transcript_14143/g.26606  ORF Transcript_14143/g.26606 Transcript_14143/m.26606 type:complete len:123 (+) Transcript_14143:34-402(+)